MLKDTTQDRFSSDGAQLLYLDSGYFQERKPPVCLNIYLNFVVYMYQVHLLNIKLNNFLNRR